MHKFRNDCLDKVVSFSVNALWGENRTLEPLSTREPSFWLCLSLKAFWIAGTLIVCLNPVLKFSGDTILTPIIELCFGVHFVCLLNKALNLDPQWQVWDHDLVGLCTCCSLSATLPCVVCLVNYCSFCKTLLKCHFLLETSSDPEVDWGTPSDFLMLLYIPLSQHLPLSFNYGFKSLLSTMGCASLESRDHVLFQVCNPSA